MQSCFNERMRAKVCPKGWRNAAVRKYDPSTQTVVGYATLIQPWKDGRVLATYCLVLMVGGIRISFNQAVEYHYIGYSFSGQDFASMIRQLFQQGLMTFVDISTITSDMGLRIVLCWRHSAILLYKTSLQSTRSWGTVKTYFWVMFPAL